MGRKAVFIDRDGTINANTDYLDDPDDFYLYPGVGKGIKKLRENDFLIVVVTNQSGLARGYFSKETLNAIHKEMERQLDQFDARIDDIYYCPHHPDDDCGCRKPGTELLEKAIEEYNIKTSESYMIGDRAMDVLAGQKLGAKGILIPEPQNREKALEEMKMEGVEPEFTCDNFQEAADWILRDERSK